MFCGLQVNSNFCGYNAMICGGKWFKMGYSLARFLERFKIGLSNKGTKYNGSSFFIGTSPRYAQVV